MSNNFEVKNKSKVLESNEKLPSSPKQIDEKYDRICSALDYKHDYKVITLSNIGITAAEESLQHYKEINGRRLDGILKKLWLDRILAKVNFANYHYKIFCEDLMDGKLSILEDQKHPLIIDDMKILNETNTPVDGQWHLQKDLGFIRRRFMRTFASLSFDNKRGIHIDGHSSIFSFDPNELFKFEELEKEKSRNFSFCRRSG